MGVFVNHSVDEVADIASSANLFAVQLHGSEDDAYINELAGKLPSQCEIWVAVGVKDSIPSEVNSHLDNKLVHRVLLDCQVGSAKGGTGESFDWSLLDNIEQKQNIILAGGISPDNVEDAIATGCGVLDVNSGVENAPGDKSAEKLAELFTVCRRY